MNDYFVYFLLFIKVDRNFFFLWFLFIDKESSVAFQNLTGTSLLTLCDFGKALADGREIVHALFLHLLTVLLEPFANRRERGLAGGNDKHLLFLNIFSGA